MRLESWHAHVNMAILYEGEVAPLLWLRTDIQFALRSAQRYKLGFRDITRACKTNWLFGERLQLSISNCLYLGSPDSTDFGPPGNHTIGKTLLYVDWFSAKSTIYDF